MSFPVFKINLKELFADVGTRTAGVNARHHLLNLLARYDLIEIDLTDVTMTPSFADECIGLLAKKLGKENFRKRIIIKNVSSTIKPLLNHVIFRRLSEHN